MFIYLPLVSVSNIIGSLLCTPELQTRLECSCLPLSIHNRQKSDNREYQLKLPLDVFRN